MCSRHLCAPHPAHLIPDLLQVGLALGVSASVCLCHKSTQSCVVVSHSRPVLSASLPLLPLPSPSSPFLPSLSPSSFAPSAAACLGECSEYWEKKPLLVRRKDRGHFDGLFSSDAIDAIVRQVCMRQQGKGGCAGKRRNGGMMVCVCLSVCLSVCVDGGEVVVI